MKRLIAWLLAASVFPVLSVASANAPPEREASAEPVSREASEAPRMRVSRLIGAPVEDAQGRAVGEVADLILDAANNRVAYAVIAAGGFLGIGERLVVIAFPDWSARAREGKLVIDRPEGLRGAPQFEPHAWPDWRQYHREVDRYYSYRDYPRVEAEHAQGVRFAPRLYRASELLAAKVEDWQAIGSRDIGNMRDIVVNLRNGKIEFAVLDFDKGIFHQGRLVAVPMPAVRRERVDSDDLVVTASRKRLATARTFDEQQWPDR